MTGLLELTYVIEDPDGKQNEDLSSLLKLDLVQKAIIKSLKGKRNTSLFFEDVSGSVTLSSRSEKFFLTINKNDYADALSLIEDDAVANKRLSKNKVVTLIDIQTKD